MLKWFKMERKNSNTTTVWWYWQIKKKKKKDEDSMKRRKIQWINKLQNEKERKSVWTKHHKEIQWPYFHTFFARGKQCFLSLLCLRYIPVALWPSYLRLALAVVHGWLYECGRGIKQPHAGTRICPCFHNHIWQTWSYTYTNQCVHVKQHIHIYI